MSCKDCKYSCDYGESVKYLKCERERKVYVDKDHKCDKFEKIQSKDK